MKLSRIDQGAVIRDLPDFQIRMAAARRRAEYEIGDASWADKIVGAFMHPAVDTDDLDHPARS